MIARRGVLVVLATGVVTLALGACGSRDSFRYKMVVEVDTPEGVKTGFAVREVYFSDRSGFPFGESRPQVKLKGEAVVVDLGGGQSLFALLTSAGGDVDYAARVADREGIWGGTQAGQIAQVWPRPAYPGKPDDHEDYKLGHAQQYPMLVRFRDPADPTSVEQVEAEALDAAFGPEVKLRRIAIEATKEPVTVEIAERLATIGIEPNHGLDRTLGETTKPTLAQKLGYSDFRR